MKIWWCAVKKKKKIMWHASLATEKNHAHINRCTGGHTYAQKLGGEARLWYQQLILQKSRVFFYFFFFFFFLSWAAVAVERDKRGRVSGDWSNETAWSQPPFRSRKHPGRIFPSFLLIRTALFFSLWLPAFMFQKPGLADKKKNASAEAFTL